MSRDDTKYKKQNNEGFYQELNLIESFFIKNILKVSHYLVEKKLIWN